MKLCCPGCGGIYGADAWENDANIRRFESIVIAMPAPVQTRIRAYLALFRPASGRGLSWKRAASLASDLAVLVGSGHVQWKKRPSRPCTPAQWGEAMDRMGQNPPNRLPVESHGYLTSIAWDIADRADRCREVARNMAERSGAAQSTREATTDGPETIDKDWMRDIADKKLKRRQKP